MNFKGQRKSALAQSVLIGIISHNPDVYELTRLVSGLVSSGCRVLVLDNDSANKDEVQKVIQGQQGVELFLLEFNIGVARAVNLLIREGVAGGAEYVVPFDQDSQPNCDAIEVLYKAFEERGRQHHIAAIGMGIVDDYTGKASGFTSFSFPLNRRSKSPERGFVTTEADFLITSGCMISLEAISEVGGMDEGFFIDNVDLEWSFRVRSKGWKLLGCFSACLRQTIGHEPIRLPLLGLVLKSHAPARYYYMTRNRILLYRRSYSPKAWIAKDCVRAVLKLIAMLVVRGDRVQVLRYHYLGFRDGLLRKTGRLGS